LNRHVVHRRRFVGVLGAATAAAAVGLPTRRLRAAEAPLRIGFQKYGSLTLLKARATLEPRLAARGVDVRWVEFPAGPQMLEAMNVGAIDLAGVGEAPPIFAQAAATDFVYIANQPAAPRAEAIVVPDGSKLQAVVELKGRRLALTKGSNVHYLVLKAFERAGVAYRDVDVVFLPPADARAAFERGAVDAWAIWDPYFAAAQRQVGARVLVDATGLASNHQFFLATRRYADAHPAVIAATVDELASLDAWARGHPAEVGRLLAPQLGLDAAIVELAASRFAYGVRPISAAVAAEQQKIADAFRELNLIPAPIRVADALPSDLLAKALQVSRADD
jgi:sulfonate transport system substrate-binding protein